MPGLTLIQGFFHLCMHTVTVLTGNLINYNHSIVNDCLKQVLPCTSKFQLQFSISTKCA